MKQLSTSDLFALTRMKQLTLGEHRIFTSDVIQDIEDLRIFMEYHVFAVWDFMSLAKRVQRDLNRSVDVWTPPVNSDSMRLISEIIIGEETDVHPTMPGTYISHFEWYRSAMGQVGANTRRIDTLVSALLQRNTAKSLNELLLNAPTPCREFCENTFRIVFDGTEAEAAAAFSYGRETAIPTMFEPMLKVVDSIDAPLFKAYLSRHIQVDGEEHGPASEELVERWCNTDADRRNAYITALGCIEARSRFLTQVSNVIESVREAKR